MIQILFQMKQNPTVYQLFRQQSNMNYIISHPHQIFMADHKREEEQGQEVRETETKVSDERSSVFL